MQLQKSPRTKEICLPVRLINNMLATYNKMEGIMDTIEIIVDKKSMSSIKKSEEQLKKGEYVQCGIEEVERVLK